MFNEYTTAENREAGYLYNISRLEMKVGKGAQSAIEIKAMGSIHFPDLSAWNPNILKS